MFVEQQGLVDGVRSQESVIPFGGGFFFVELRTCFQTAAATHAGGHGVAHLLVIWRVNRPGTKVVGAIDGHPRFHALEVVEQPLPVDHQIANHREFAHGFKNNFIAFAGGVFIDQCGAALADFTIDHHRARPANFFQTPTVEHHRG